MQKRILITFHHKEKIAKMSILDSDNNIVVDQNGQILENMSFPYSHFEFYKDLFEEIEDNGVIGYYYLKK